VSDDPHPEWRCACIGWVTSLGAPDPYRNRCGQRPTQEDLFCDHCRRTCQQERTRRSVPLLTPCVAVEVPF
jgi:hypothetical protein